MADNGDEDGDGALDDDDEILKDLNHEKIAAFLETTIEPRELSFYLIRVYLQYCIYIWNDNSPKLNNLLIDVYKYFIENICKYLSEFKLIDQTEFLDFCL